MKNMKNKIKKRYVITVFLLLSLSTIQKVNASSIPILKNTPIGKLYEELSYQVKSIGSFFGDFLTNDIKGLSEDLGGNLEKVVSEAIGDLGIPDINEARKNVEKVASESENVVYKGEPVTNEIDRQISRAIIDANLSKKGQQKNISKTQATQDAIEQVDSSAQQAQQRVSTQFVIKDIANQNKEIEATLGAIRNDELQEKVTEDLQLANLTNISNAIDSQNKEHQQEIVGEAYDIISVTSRARLF